MTSRSRYYFGDPLGDQVDDDDDPELDQVDEYDRPELGQAWEDFVTIGKIGAALMRATPRRPAPSSRNVIDMHEIAPGVFARKPVNNPERRMHPISRIERLERAFAALRKELE